MTARVERVVAVVFDGLRPDMIAGRMPNLEAFAGESVRFTEASSVFPSLTRVAMTSFATGCWPERHGIVSNTFHLPAFDRTRPLDTSTLDRLLTAEATVGPLVEAPTLGERLAETGRRLGVFHGGSAGAAFFAQPRAAETDGWTVSVHGEAATLTPEAVRRAVTEAGPLPDMDIPRTEAVEWIARASEPALGDDGPEVVLIWLPEPDTSFHYREIGSDAADAAMRAADAAFGRILVRARRGGRPTGVIALSDHGQIATTARFEIERAMRADGLAAAERPGEGDRLALTLGVSGEVRMREADPGLIEAAASWLMGREEIGMVFARDDLLDRAPGALPLSAVRLLHRRAAELVYVTRAEPLDGLRGLPGRCIATGGPPVGGGAHGGLHRREMNTTLMVAAPGAAAGAVDDRPCGLIDVAPTILALLGLDAADMDGEPLPLDGSGAKVETETLEAGRGGFLQRLVRRRAGDRVRLHEGGRA